MSPTYLIVDYSQRHSVKALGARWDATERKWYVPDGRDLTPFNDWLPVRSGQDELAPAPLSGFAVEIQPRGKSLSILLSGVAAAIERTFGQSEWTVVEVVDARVKSHVYLEVAERDSHGVVLAKASAMIWSNTASEILPRFEAATGMSIGPGMKLLLRVEPVFSAQYGFRLVVDAIDPEFTLGELEARKRDIRERLQQQGLWDANKRLNFPWDFNAVLVVSPPEAAGLGDFRVEAQRLEQAGVCRFVYVHSRFQGPGAAEQIVEVARKALVDWSVGNPSAPDAVVFIRGGGAVSDLAWLNNYDLARFVCDLQVPVFTGIGHERDTTILDQVAHTCFDTPSKVIAGIELAILKRVREAAVHFRDVAANVRRQLTQMRQTTELARSSIRAGVSSIVFTARETSDHSMTQVSFASLRLLHSAIESSRDRIREVQAEARNRLAFARAQVPSLLADVRDRARHNVRTASASSAGVLTDVLSCARGVVTRAAREVDANVAATLYDGQQLVLAAKVTTEGQIREVQAHASTQVVLARERTPLLLADVRDCARQSVGTASSNTNGAIAAVLGGARSAAGRSRRNVDASIATALHESCRITAAAKVRGEGLVREITGQGPEKTLARGFAHIRDASGSTVQRAGALGSNDSITITFHDGTLGANVSGKEIKR